MTDMNRNPNGNPNIAEYGKDVQFGKPKGPDPVEARKNVKVNPSSIRSCLRRLMTFPLNPNVDLKEQMTVASLLGYLGYGHKEPTLAMLAAVQAYKHGVESGKIMMQLMDQVDGKLVEKTMTTGATLEQLVTGDYDVGQSDE